METFALALLWVVLVCLFFVVWAKFQGKEKNLIMKEKKIGLEEIKTLDDRHGFVVMLPAGVELNPDVPEQVNKKIVEGEWANKELSFYVKLQWNGRPVIAFVFPSDTQFDSGEFYRSFAGKMNSPVRVDTLSMFIKSLA